MAMTKPAWNANLQFAKTKPIANIQSAKIIVDGEEIGTLHGVGVQVKAELSPHILTGDSSFAQTVNQHYEIHADSIAIPMDSPLIKSLSPTLMPIPKPPQAFTEPPTPSFELHHTFIKPLKIVRVVAYKGDTQIVWMVGSDFAYDDLAILSNVENTYAAVRLTQLKNKYVGLPTDTPSMLTDEIPGINNIVQHPVNKNNETISQIIISLNDSYQWTREQIADWLDTLDEQPSYDLTQITTTKDEPPPISSSASVVQIPRPEVGKV